MSDINQQELEDLNYDCNYNIFLAKQYINNLKSISDKQRASKWIRKLISSKDNNTNIDCIKIRNDFLYYLILNLQSGQLECPFTSDPPCGNLLSLINLLPNEKLLPPENNFLDENNFHNGNHNNDLPLLYKQSPDGGAFLSKQPIPKCGAFCYLAIVCNDENEK